MFILTCCFNLFSAGQLKRSPTKGTIHLTQPPITTTNIVKVTNTTVSSQAKGVAVPSFANTNNRSPASSVHIPLHQFPARTPVTQLLAHTLNQRQLLQRQQKAAQGTNVILHYYEWILQKSCVLLKTVKADLLCQSPRDQQCTVRRAVFLACF